MPSDDARSPTARTEALRANPDNEADEAQRELTATGRPTALPANPDAEADEAERRLTAAVFEAARTEALGANPDTEADETDRLYGREDETSARDD